jgi:hypothetical protein
MFSYQKFFKISIKILRVLSIWIDGSSTRRHIISVLLHLNRSLIAVTFQVLFFVMTDNWTIGSVVDIIAMMPSYIAAAIRIAFFEWKQEKFKKLLKDFDDLVEMDFWMALSGGKKLKQKSDRIIRVVKVHATMAVVAWFLSFPFTGKELPYKMWMPFDISSSKFLFIITVIWQQTLIIVPFIAAFLIEMFALVWLNLLTGITEELGDRMANIGWKIQSKKKKVVKFKEDVPGTSQAADDQDMKVKTKEEDKALKELMKCIEIQMKINEIIQSINEIFGIVIWIQGFLSTVILCTTSYALSIVRLCRIRHLLICFA